MARLSDLDIVRCAECGKLIQKGKGRLLCSECAGEQRQPRPALTDHENQIIESVAKRTGLSRAAIEKTLHDEALEAAGQHRESCVRCKERFAVEDSDLCIYCILDLYRSLGDASKELFGRMEVLEEEPFPTKTVVSLLKDKERLTASKRIDFSSGPHLRW